MAVSGRISIDASGNLLATAILFFSGFSAPQRVDGLSFPLASDPINVRNQWDLPGRFGSVTIPGACINANSFSRGTFFDDDDDDDDDDDVYSPLLPVDSNAAIPYSHDYSHEHGYDYYGDSHRTSSFGSRRLTSSALSMTSYPPPQVWRYNDLFVGGKPRTARGNRRSNSRPWATPALSMANFMQNGGPGSNSNYGSRSGNHNNGGNNNYNNEGNNYGNNRGNNNYNNDRSDYNNGGNNNHNNRGNNHNNRSNNYNNRGKNYNDNYDNYSGRNRNHEGPHNNDRYRQQPPPGSNGPRGNTRFNTVGGLGTINGANLSRDGRSLQFQNRRDSNNAGRSGRMMDDPYTQFAPDNNSRFESRLPNDNYARGGYRRDSRDGYWKDPNDYNVQNGPSYSNSRENNRYESQSVPSSGFKPIPPGEYVTAPAVSGGPFGYETGRGGSGGGGNVPYDSAYYNNGYDNRGFSHNRDSDDDYYSLNGNVMDNRRRSSGRGAPGANENYFNLDYQDSNRRMDRGGGLFRYRPNYNQRGGNGYDNSNEYYYDDYFDSSGSFYNHEGKRVRRFDPSSDRREGYYNPDSITNDITDPERMVQNQRRRDGRDVKSGATLRRYNPAFDSNQGLYDEAALYGSEVKGSRHYNPTGRSDDMSHRVVPRRRINRQDPPGGWGEANGRDDYSVRPNDRYPEFRDDEYPSDGYDRGLDQFDNRERDGRFTAGDRDRRGDDYYDDYNEYDVDGRSRRGGARRGLGRRDMDSERDYYRSGDYGGPELRGDDTMERFRQGKDVKKNDPYGFETGNTPSNKRRIQRGRDPRMDANRQGGGRQRVGMRRPEEDRQTGRGSTVNGSYNPPLGSRDGRINGSGNRDRGLSLDDLNEML
mmetsp:Transcript_8894/g.21729  ORF Transcript_8894/g.21729 Transcript_8894/m.21729 type:complete len:870 (-) Transcript_8894:387-2996(-)